MADAGFLAFWSLTALMMLAAGGAAMPPVRDFDTFRGAILMVVLLLVFGAIQNVMQTMAAVDGFWFLDALAAILFYLIAKRRRLDTPESVRSRDWASYVCLIYVVMTLVEMMHFSLGGRTALHAAVFGAVSLFSAATFYGAFRALRPAWTLLGFGSVAALIWMTINHFILLVNCLTAVAILVILISGGRGLVENLRVRIFERRHVRSYVGSRQKLS